MLQKLELEYGVKENNTVYHTKQSKREKVGMVMEWALIRWDEDQSQK